MVTTKIFMDSTYKKMRREPKLLHDKKLNTIEGSNGGNEEQNNYKAYKTYSKIQKLGE